MRISAQEEYGRTRARITRAWPTCSPVRRRWRGRSASVCCPRCARSKVIEELTYRGYKHSFSPNIDVDSVPTGLNEDIIRVVPIDI